jgi:hypothetical protein
LILKEFEKGREKKERRKGPHLLLSARSGPLAQLLLPQIAHLRASFFFFQRSLTRWPHSSVPFFLLLAPLSPLFQAGVTTVKTATPARAPSPPLPFSIPIKGNKLPQP